MDLWMKIAWAALLVVMLIVLLPRARHMVKHGPKAGEGDWRAAILPLLLVVGFVVLLIAMVAG